MPKIEILEKDLTTPGVVSESTDVAYIPGFVDTTQTCLYSNGKYIGLGVNDPHLFTSVAEFESLCGKMPALFGETQMYTEDFAEGSYDVSAVMFNEGDPDPAYVMAKELLASGLSVMYERVNSEPSDYIKLDGVPSDFSTNFTNYYFYYDGKSLPTDSRWASLGILYPDKAPEWKEEFYIHVVDGKLEDHCVTQATLDDLGVTWEEYYKECYTLVESDVGYNQCLNGYHTYDGELYGVNPSPDNISADAMYKALSSIYSTDNITGIIDKGNYSVKYLTSGGYPVFEYKNGALVVKMLAFAEKRGDCVALIDHTDYMDRELDPYKAGSLYKTVKDAASTLFADSGEYGAMFTPWAKYIRTTSDTTTITAKKYAGTPSEVTYTKEYTPEGHPTEFRAPGSFAYLMSLADSIKTNANWLAIAGAARGGVRNLSADGMTTVIPNGVADAMQPRDGGVAVNAITNISPYGHTIWGNRTLKPIEHNLIATNFLNIRNLVSDIKKTCYRVARATTFEQNTDVLWLNFSSQIATLLDRMKSGFGISGYKIVKDTEHAKAAEKATLCAKIIIYPTYAVEDFYITVVLKDDEVSVN